jgi:hypothetical protein
MRGVVIMAYRTNATGGRSASALQKRHRKMSSVLLLTALGVVTIVSTLLFVLIMSRGGAATKTPAVHGSLSASSTATSVAGTLSLEVKTNLEKQLSSSDPAQQAQALMPSLRASLGKQPLLPKSSKLVIHPESFSSRGNVGQVKATVTSDGNSKEYMLQLIRIKGEWKVSSTREVR